MRNLLQIIMVRNRMQRYLSVWGNLISLGLFVCGVCSVNALETAVSRARGEKDVLRLIARVRN